MRPNRGRPAVAGPDVEEVMSAVAARLAERHPTLSEATVNSVVYQAAVDLVSTVTDTAQLRCLLERRAHARLMAMTGQPIVITTRVTAPLPQFVAGGGPAR